MIYVHFIITAVTVSDKQHRRSKTLFIFQTYAHYYKNHRMLKEFKIITLAPTCFGSRRNHHQGAVLCLAKTTKYGFSVLVGRDAVNVMAAYQPVVQAYGSQWRHCLHSERCKHEEHRRCYFHTDLRTTTPSVRFGRKHR